MDEFFGGVIAVVITSVVMFSSCSYGEAVNESYISKQCKDFDKFSIGDTVYDCKQNN